MHKTVSCFIVGLGLVLIIIWNGFAADFNFWSQDKESWGKTKTSGKWQLSDSGGQFTSGFSTQSVGGYTWSMESGYLYTVADTNQPSAITNFSALTGGEGAVSLIWTAPGDDGLTGSAESYVVRYSTAAIDTETEFNTATNYSNSWTPQVAGSTETHTVDGLTAGVTYYFAIKSKDEYDNISNLSNSAFVYAGSSGGMGATKAPVDPFELGEVYSFPNPAKRCNPCLHIEVGFADSIEVKIYNIAGELVYKTELAGNPLLINNKYAYEYVWDTGGVASGVYIYLIGAKRSGFNEIKVMKKMAV